MMKEYAPSRDFVKKVMRAVSAFEQERRLPIPLSQRLFAIKAARFAFSAGGILMGILNLVRFYLSAFSPAICR